MPALTGKWEEELRGEFGKEYYRKLFTIVKQEYDTHRCYPPSDDIFNAFHFTPLDQVKVVILGQDPYHEEGQAHGLSFSVKPGQIVGVREKSKSLEVIADALAGFNHSKYPWIEWDEQQKAGKFLHRPERADIPEPIKEQLIVELYSKN